MVSKRLQEALDGDSEISKAPPPVTIPEPDSDVQVRTTVSYKGKLNEKKATETDDDTESENGFAYGRRDYGIPFRPFMPQGVRHVKENTLAGFFNALSEATTENGEENFLIMITRLPDMPSESFARPQVMYPANFPAMQCNVGAFATFINEIQKLNGRSGGRFEIRACLLNGEAIEDAYLNNFVVPDPAQPLNVDSGNNSNLDMIQAVERMANENRMFMERMLTTLKPEKSELDEIARQVMMKKLLSDDSPQRDNPEDMLMKMMLMPQMVETFADKMRDAMNGSKPDADQPTWMKLLESPMGAALGEKAGTIIENFSQLAVVAATAKAQQAGTMPPPVQPDRQAPQVATPIQPNPATPQPETTETDNGDSDPMTELIEDLIDEVENGTPFNDDNEFLQELRQDYPMEASFVKMLCNDNPFDELFKQLATKAPQVFEPFIDPVSGQANERGQHAVMRLREFYFYMRGETDPVAPPPMAVATEPLTADPPKKKAVAKSPNTDKTS